MRACRHQEWTEHFEAKPQGSDKVLPLKEAIRQNVRPGMALHFTFTHNRPAAAMAELLRQFRGKDPRFTLIHLFTAGPAVAMLTEGLVRRLITTLICEPYPSPAPSRPAQRALAQGVFTVEQWSVLSFIARLQAAALGLPTLPVRSLKGSTLAEENREAIESKEHDGTLEVKALSPDLSFVHAPCADRFGHVLLTPPYGEGVWGALAARDGVVATVERIIDSETLRRHAHRVGIPASHVRSVSVVPFGGHPAGLASGGIEGVEPYGDDVDFYSAGREAGATDESWSRFVREWFLDRSDQEDYLAHLGASRMLRLKGKARPDSWRAELLTALSEVSLDRPPTRTEAMILAAAHLIAEKVEANDYRSILSGLGAGNLAAWVAHARLTSRGRSTALVAELGLYGYTPRPCDPYLFNFRNLATCTLQADAMTSLGLLMGGANARCLGSLGAAQVDGKGNFNSTRLADGALLVGSGGANDVASSAEEVVITLRAGPGRLVKAVPYITGPGERVTAVVTDLGIFEKNRGPGRLVLTRLVGPLLGDDRETHLRELAQRTGFRFQLAESLSVEPPPDPVEVERLRLYDPGRAFLGEGEGADG